jgi:hypothetical protein
MSMWILSVLLALGASSVMNYYIAARGEISLCICFAKGCERGVAVQAEGAGLVEIMFCRRIGCRYIVIRVHAAESPALQGTHT